MEALVIATLAGLGWTLSTKKEQVSKRDPTPQPTLAPRGASYTDDDSRPSDQLHAFSEDAIARWNASQFPERTGIISPLYSSMRVQNTNDDVKQRRLEQFTGNDITWKQKREVEQLFKPTPQQIDSSGSEGNAPAYLNTTIGDSVTQIQNSTLPFQQIRVGPGIDVPMDVPAADGFHSMYRAMPVNGYAHKSREMAGSIIPGGAENQQQLVDPTVPHNKPPRVYDMSRRPLEQGRSSVTGPSVRGRHTSIHPLHGTDPHSGKPYQCHVDGDEYFGIKYRDATYDNASEMTRMDDRTQDGEFLGLATSVHAPQKYPQSAPAPTERNIIESRTNGPGPARYRVDKERHNCTGKQLLKQSKRSHYVEADRMAGPSYPNALRRTRMGQEEEPYLSKMYTMHKRAQVEGYKPHGSLAQPPSQAPVQNRPPKKYGGENPYQDYSLASVNLQNNPYVVRPRPTQ